MIFMRPAQTTNGALCKQMSPPKYGMLQSFMIRQRLPVVRAAGSLTVRQQCISPRANKLRSRAMNSPTITEASAQLLC